MMKFKLLPLYIFFLVSVSLWGQTKNEKESRVQLTQFPEPAQLVLEQTPDAAKRTRYYRETDGEKLSFESKFKFNSHWYSVEFSAKGVLEDIEVLIKSHDLPERQRDAIESYLEANSNKFEIIKIQEQYRFETPFSGVEFLNHILEQRTNTASYYELIVALKIKKEWFLKEMTFDPDGRFINARTLQPDSYEYIMY